jgi:hypothetical protein
MTGDSTRTQRSRRAASANRRSTKAGLPVVQDTARKHAIRLLDEWMADDSGYDEETWPVVREALNRDRLSTRRLFDG